MLLSEHLTIDRIAVPMRGPTKDVLRSKLVALAALAALEWMYSIS